ncbi:hypothetical protein [Dactylosporangium sp. NPDC005555]|uniref:hypothetical protein n=1 Tax=Dactylosporangium sp. NPDC005555 TaxID=3154889 RepID=UPI0033A0BD75
MNRRLRPAVAAVILASSLGSSAAFAADEPKHAVCSSRACLVLLESWRDRDRDGVADVDEKLAGTSMDDPNSAPDPAKLLDLLLERKLESFERHFTELVLLPTVTPDGRALATGLGEFPIVDHDANLLASMGIVLDALDVNGWDLQFGLKVNGSKQPPTYGITPGTMSGTTFLTKYDRSLYSAGTAGGLSQFGANSGKEVQDETLGGVDGKPYIDYSGGGATQLYSINYTDGSKDIVRNSVSQDKNTKEASSSVRSVDPQGETTGEVYRYQRESTAPDGTKTTTLSSSQPTKDANGQVNGSKSIRVTIIQRKDGTGKLTSTTTTTDADGNIIEQTETEADCDAACAKKEKEAATKDEFIDPDSIGFDIVTELDLARLETRIKHIGQPGPDNGDTQPAEPQPSGSCPPACGNDGLLVLMDPDAVVVVATSEPNFNRHLFPDYDPWLEEISGMAGQPVPVTGVQPGPVPTVAPKP